MSTRSFLFLCVTACTVCKVPTTGDAGGGTVLSVLGRDTVLLVRDTVSRIEWRSAVGGRSVRRWVSAPLYNTVPTSQLRYIDGDSIPDLFVTLSDEEMISGSVLLGTTGVARVAYMTRSPVCLVPDLRDVNGDGKVDIVEHLPGAVSREECIGDAAAAPCMNRYHLTWERVLLQRPNGIFADDSGQAHAFYDSMSAEYTKAAGQLNLDLLAGMVPSTRCNAAMLVGIKQMASRAQRLAKAR